jgi:hypothetical protein
VAGGCAAGLLRYSNLGEFNQTALSLGVAHRMALESWYFELGANGTQLTLGGMSTSARSRRAQVTRAFSHQQSLHAQLRAAFGRWRGGVQRHLGQPHRLRDRLHLGLAFVELRAHASTERNDTQDDFFAQDWNEWGADARWAFSPLWNFSAGATWRRTRHPAQRNSTSRL